MRDEWGRQLVVGKQSGMVSRESDGEARAVRRSPVAARERGFVA